MTDNDKTFLALDFDGVIADSISECLIVGYNSFAVFSKSQKRIYDLNSLQEETITKFYHLRNYIRSGEDYIYIWMIISGGLAIESQAQYDDFIDRNSNLKSHFFNLFYKERQRILSENQELWLKLNPLYPGLKTFLENYEKREDFAIISTKKSDFIQLILYGHGLNISKEHIFQADKKKSKLEIITALIKTKNLDSDTFHFIDDQVDTLIKIKPAGINIYLAEWGYNDERQRAKAVAESITVLSRKNFLKNAPYFNL